MEEVPAAGPNNDPKSQSPEGAVLTYQAAFAGPLPPPKAIKQYEEVLPGAADRIIAMAENQSSHRQKIETKVINSDILNSKLGLIFGFIIGLVGIIGGVYVVVHDKAFAGGFIITGTLVSLVGTFVYGSRQRRSERQQSQDDSTSSS